jgi:hypothetical protein
MAVGIDKFYSQGRRQAYAALLEPIMSETAAAAPQAAPKKGDHQPDGRYIPYSGGCMGWFENSGVMKSEMHNAYTFSAALDADVVRSRQYERTGEMAVINKRGEPRLTVHPEVKVEIVSGKTVYSAISKDLSSKGMRVQFTDEVKLSKGDAVQVNVFEADAKKPAMDIKANVAWSNKMGRIRIFWNVGVAFVTLSEPDVEKLRKIMGVREIE